MSLCDTVNVNCAIFNINTTDYSWFMFCVKQHAFCFVFPEMNTQLIINKRVTDIRKKKII